LTFDVAGFVEALTERGHMALRGLGRPGVDEADDRCCARAARGHATAAPPSSVMNSRRFMLNIAGPPPAFSAPPM
jgi:hypothetical protein